MYAIIITGGKQYRVAEGDTIRIEKLIAEVGDQIDFDKILMVAQDQTVTVGTPHVPNAKVLAEVIAQDRLDKVTIIKFRRRKHYRKQMGHRQYFTKIKITKIQAN